MKHNTNRMIAIFFLLPLSCSPAQDEAGSGEAHQPAEIVDPPSTMAMVYMPAGSFLMGSTGSGDESSLHEVHLDDFYMGRFEVTQAQWQAVMGSNPSEFQGEDHPVETVTWYEVQEFASRLSELTGERYRLPTEAEWEYAARAGTSALFHFGNDSLKLGEYAWFSDNSGMTTHPVGQKKPNDWGLYDMAGNVREWCQDWWDPGFYERSPSVNPINELEYFYTNSQTGAVASYRAVRSESFGGAARGAEVAHRQAEEPDKKHRVFGFRLVREVRR